jgi:hypothetical protein
MQLDRALALDQQHDGGPCPQGKVHFQLLGTLLLDQTLNMLFLRGSQAATTACRPSALAQSKPGHALLFIPLDDHANRGITQANFVRDPMPIHSALIGPDHLPPALMLR